MSPILVLIDSGSVVVAVSLMALVGIIMIVAIIKYPKMEDVLKLWAGMGTLVGVLAGSMATYFFTKDAADKSIAKVEAEKKTLIAEKTSESDLRKNAEAALVAEKVRSQTLNEQFAKLDVNSRFEEMALAGAHLEPWGSHEVSYPVFLSRPRNPIFEDLITDENEREQFNKALSGVQRTPAGNRVDLLKRLIAAAETKDADERTKALGTIRNDIAAFEKTAASKDTAVANPP